MRKTLSLPGNFSFARKVKIDGDGNLVATGRSGFMIIVK